MDEEEEQQNLVKQETAHALTSKQADLEVLSSLDPEDEFLQSRKSVSMIESIASQTSDAFSIISSKSSEFSVISNSKIHSIIMSVYSSQSLPAEERSLELASQISSVSGKGSAMSMLNSSRFSTIENERDAYAEDIVMQKVIYYVSLFSEDVKSRLQEMRSKDTLGHLEVKQND